ncbi:hypothetical protein [Amphritea sp.]|uniref:hypothetical protein n=1 Tax=Amphritea sp. TaxID=1872502 RepID=UPI00345737BF
MNAPAISRVKEVYFAGVDKNIFRSELSAERLHWQISAMCFLMCLIGLHFPQRLVKSSLVKRAGLSCVG